MAQQTIRLHNPNGDLEVPGPFDADSWSSISFSPSSDLLAATNWNNNTYCWQYNLQGQTQPKAQQGGTACMLCNCWKADGSGVFIGGCDKLARFWDLASNSVVQVGSHDAPIRHLAFLPQIGILVTGSWDKTFRYWDPRSPNPAYTGTLPERVYAMDLRDEVLIIATAGNYILRINTAQPQEIKPMENQLKWQTKCVAIFPDKAGFLHGSIEGRVAVTYFDPAAKSRNFTYKCHREGTSIFSVNSINFHPRGTFATCGSDGAYSFWDKDSKQRLKAMIQAKYTPDMPAPIPCAAFSRDGAIYGYALSYDWSRGYDCYRPEIMRPYLMLHQVKEDEVVPKVKGAPAAGRK